MNSDSFKNNQENQEKITEQQESKINERQSYQTNLEHKFLIIDELILSKFKSASLNPEFPRLSIILKEYPKDSNPLDFFTQKSNYFIESLK